ncbi:MULTISPECIES: hypothetical protein [unclassified Chryseobacterium]|uniref:hypothetical protein n=1 Tax=unclassified Chryseobacterium TaxID=2593645 RepID=UPI0022699AF1|nr:MULTISPECIES: hypothetical protein [unclassified Chryseobacterium]
MKIKLLFTLSFLMLLNLKCISQQNKEKQTNNTNITSKNSKIEKIQITEQTRGTNKLITFTPLSKTISVNGETTTSSITSEKWQNIDKEASLIDLEKISTYESPTTGRFSDRALASSIIISVDGKQYKSSSFDAGMPPKELEALYNVLNNGIIKKRPTPRIR